MTNSDSGEQKPEHDQTVWFISPQEHQIGKPKSMNGKANGDIPNLNRLQMLRAMEYTRRTDGTHRPDWHTISLSNHKATSSSTEPIRVHFDDIESVVVELAKKHEVAVGAVAWLTNQKILTQLSSCKRVAVIVQKEDFLRADAGDDSFSNRKNRVRALYDSLPEMNMWDFEETYPGQQEFHPDFSYSVQNKLFDASGMFQFGGSAVRCIGHFSDGKKTVPRMHHKFLVFGRYSKNLVMHPECVLTGSFNMTKNAVASKENVLVVRHKEIVHAYLSEWAQLWAMSEELDWTSKEPAIQEAFLGT